MSDLDSTVVNIKEYEKFRKMDESLIVQRGMSSNEFVVGRVTSELQQKIKKRYQSGWYRPITEFTNISGQLNFIDDRNSSVIEELIDHREAQKNSQELLERFPIKHTKPLPKLPIKETILDDEMENWIKMYNFIKEKKWKKFSDSEKNDLKDSITRITGETDLKLTKKSLTTTLEHFILENGGELEKIPIK